MNWALFKNHFYNLSHVLFKHLFKGRLQRDMFESLLSLSAELSAPIITSD